MTLNPIPLDLLLISAIYNGIDIPETMTAAELYDYLVELADPDELRHLTIDYNLI